MPVALVIEVGMVNPNDPAGYAASLGIPANVIADCVFRHTILLSGFMEQLPGQTVGSLLSSAGPANSFLSNIICHGLLSPL